MREKRSLLEISYVHVNAYHSNEANEFIESQREEWELAWQQKKRIKILGGGLKFLLMSMLYKMQTIVNVNNTLGLILGTDANKMNSLLALGEPPARVHPPYHLHLSSYYCSTNQSCRKFKPELQSKMPNKIRIVIMLLW